MRPRPSVKKTARTKKSRSRTDRQPPKKALLADLRCGIASGQTEVYQTLSEIGFTPEVIALHGGPRPGMPEAQHYVDNLATVRPNEIMPKGMLDLLLADPMHTPHMLSRDLMGEVPRNNPWYVPQWCTQARVRRLIVQSTPDFVDWGPMEPETGEIIEESRGSYFRSWLRALERIGFRIAYKNGVALGAPGETPHERFVLIGRSDRRRVHWPDALPAGGTSLSPFVQQLFAN